MNYHTLPRARDVATLSIQVLEAITPGPANETQQQKMMNYIQTSRDSLDGPGI